MNGLQAQFGEQIEFVVLDIDDPATLPLRQHYNMVQRTNYVLVNARGEVVQRWFGPLDEDQVARALREFLANPGS